MNEPRKFAVILPDDTIESFALRNNVSIEDVIMWNNLPNKNYNLQNFSDNPYLFIEDEPFDELDPSIIIASSTTKKSKPIPSKRTYTQPTPGTPGSSAIDDFNSVLGKEESKSYGLPKASNTFGGVYSTVALKRIGGSVPVLEFGGEVEKKPSVFDYIKGYVPKLANYFKKETEEPEQVQEEPQSELLTTEQFKELNTNEKVAYISNELQKGGLEDWEAIGFTAVMYNESGLNPNAENQMEKKKWTGDQAYKYGRGLCQWSLSRNDSFRDFYRQKYGNMVWASEADVNDQLEFALKERSERRALLNRINEIKQMYNAQQISKEQAAILAADAYRRGFENGTSRALASSKQMDAYSAVGSPNASAINNKDTRMVKQFLNIHNS